jgi:hypothetical protein
MFVILVFLVKGFVKCTLDGGGGRFWTTAGTASDRFIVNFDGHALLDKLCSKNGGEVLSDGVTFLQTYFASDVERNPAVSDITF